MSEEVTTGTGTPTSEAPEEEVAEAPAPPEPAPVAEAPEAEHSPAEARTAKNMFSFSGYVHVGPGAETCAGGEDGSCADPLHFHGWCRLPNPYQKESIREKALAAKARRARMLRDADCDAWEILEQDMESLSRASDGNGNEDLVEELIAQRYWENQSEAMKNVQDKEEYEHIEEDLERYRALGVQPEEERNESEYKSLEKHISAFEDAIEEERKELEQPERESLMSRDTYDLVEMIREQRIEAESNEWFMREYTKWTQFIGTMKPRPADKGLPNERFFGDINHLKDQAAPEVVDALSEMFGELESSKNKGSLLGN